MNITDIFNFLKGKGINYFEIVGHDIHVLDGLYLIKIYSDRKRIALQKRHENFMYIFDTLDQLTESIITIPTVYKNAYNKNFVVNLWCNKLGTQSFIYAPFEKKEIQDKLKDRGITNVLGRCFGYDKSFNKYECEVLDFNEYLKLNPRSAYGQAELKPFFEFRHINNMRNKINEKPNQKL